jgi:hypothetical protein
MGLRWRSGKGIEAENRDRDKTVKICDRPQSKREQKKEDQQVTQLNLMTL